MAYSDPGDAVPGAVITAAWGDAVRADCVESALARVAVKGDLAVATALNVLARLAVGTDGRGLFADSGEATGLIWQLNPACHLTNSAPQLIANSAWDDVDFDVETRDDGGLHVPGSPELITIPVGADGWYIFGANLTASRAAAADKSYLARIILNGVTVLCQSQTESDRPAYLSMSGAYYLSAADEIKVQVYVDLADLSVAADSSFWAVFQRP